MARKKKTDLPEVDVSKLGVSGETPQKPRSRARGCLNWAALLLIGACAFSYFSSPRKPTTALPTASVLPTETPIPLMDAATAVPVSATVMSVSSSSGSTSTLDNGQVNWTIDRVQTQNKAGEWNPKKDMSYLVVIGTINNYSDKNASLRASQIRLLVDGIEYAPINGLMDRIKPELNGIDFIGAYSGFDITAGQSRQAFAAFEVPLIRDSVSLRLDTQTLALDPASGIEIAIGATATPDASETAISLTGAAAFVMVQATLTQEAGAEATIIKQTQSAPTATITDTPASIAIALPTSAPTQTEMFFTTALPQQSELEYAYRSLNGITSVDMVSVRGGIVYAEVTHRAGVNRRTLADEMLRLALSETASPSLNFSVIFTDGQTCEDYMFDLQTDDWRTTSITCPSAPVVAFTPEEGLGTEIDPATYYAGSGGANIRSCTKTSCNVVGRLAGGDAIVSNYVVNGDSVETGNAIWYRVTYNGVTGYVYSGVVSSVKPATTTNTASQPANPPVVVVPGSNQSGGGSQQSVPPAAPGFTCPSNCTEAKAMGVSAQQAAACGLDRDGDGVACYGD